MTSARAADQQPKPTAHHQGWEDTREVAALDRVELLLEPVGLTTVSMLENLFVSFQCGRYSERDVSPTRAEHRRTPLASTVSDVPRASVGDLS